MTRTQRRFLWIQTPGIAFLVLMIVISRAQIFTDWWMDAMVALVCVLMTVGDVRGYRDAGRHASK